MSDRTPLDKIELAEIEERHEAPHGKECSKDCWVLAHMDAPRLLGDVEWYREKDGLARDALYRSGYLSLRDHKAPLHELIGKLNADARGVVGTTATELAELRRRVAFVRGLCSTANPRHDQYDFAQAILSALDGAS